MFTLPIGTPATAAISYVDSKGNPAKVDGAPKWSSSDETILSVFPSTDGMVATIEAAGGLGTAQVKVEADADLGGGVKPIITLGDVEVAAGEAVAGTLTFALSGTP